MGLLDLLKKGARRMTGEKEYRDIFELDGVPACREFYNFTILPAKYIYRGLYTPWHVIPAPTIGDKERKRTLYRMNMGKAVCAELAGLIWSEGVKIDISNETLQEFVLDVLHKNNFSTKMQEHIEQAAALGGGALKEYVKFKRKNGEPVPGTERIVIDYAMADQFVPTAWDNAAVSEAVFVSRKAKDGYYYTRLEWHKWNGETYVITNDLYRAPMKDGSGNNQDILGYHYPLANMYPELQPFVKIDDLDTSLFAYYRTPIANNVDDNSPLGVSIYGNAFDTLHALDICFDSFVREFRLGKKRIIVPASAVRVVADPQTGDVRRYFDANDETYEALNSDDPEKMKVMDNSIELRVDEHVAAINAFLSILCLQVGFSAGTFTFDLHDGLKTATEVISENSKTYKTIRNFQQQLIPAIKKTCENIITLGVLYEMEYDGKSIASLADDYEITVSMEDAVLEDTNTKYDKAIKLVGAGLISKRTAMTAPEYGLCMTDETADAELEQIAKESPVNAFMVDRFSTTGE